MKSAYINVFDYTNNHYMAQTHPDSALVPLPVSPPSPASIATMSIDMTPKIIPEIINISNALYGIVLSLLGYD